MFPHPTARRGHPYRPSARRCRSPLVEGLEGRRLLSGSSIHHRPDATPAVVASVDLAPPTGDAARGTGGSGGGGGSGKVRFQ